LAVIPVLGVPILSRPELLYAHLNSVDHDVRQTVIIDNGDVVSSLEMHHRFVDFPYLDAIRIVSPGHNIGVAASWNFIIKTNPNAPWWFITSFDVAFGKGNLETMVGLMEDPSPKVVRVLGFAAFGVNVAAVEAVGFFDENIHPAYNEDADYEWRCKLTGVPLISVHVEGLTHIGSATIHGNPAYERANVRTHGENNTYYRAKWGGVPFTSERYTTPFGLGGHTRESPVSIRRLARLAWPLR
jgi:GT2 family glycosyltransferase